MKRLFLVLSMWLLASSLACAESLPWPDATYSQYANQQPIERTLREFAKSFNLTVQVGPGVEGVVNGRFTNRTPTEFIDHLSGAYGLSWFTHAGVLYVARISDTTTRSLPVPGGATTSVHRALQELGVLDARFGWGELAEQDLVFVSGPPAYVDMIQRILASLPTAPGGQELRMFKIHHASVTDRTVSYRDKDMTFPGLATVLRQLVEGASAPGGETTVAAGGSGLESSLSPLPGMAPMTPLAPAGSASDAAPAGAGRTKVGAAHAAAEKHNARAPRILAEPRLNAIIIQDAPERMPMYEKLIASLDVPTQLIEIEAMIIDVSTDHMEELGIGWSARTGGTSWTLGDVSVPSDSASVISAATGISPTATALDIGRHLLARVKALESRGQAEIQSRPSILTTDNEGALIDMSQTFYIQTTSERAASVTSVTAGTQLRVTPKLIDLPGGKYGIQLLVHIEDGQIEQTTIGGLPTVTRSVVDTDAVVNNDSTLTIGGYRTDTTNKNHAGVPYLSSLPLLGRLFSSDDSHHVKRDRLFMIRPRVVSLVDMAPARAAP